MQKLLKIMQSNFLARLFVYAFNSNFFYLQTFGMFTEQHLHRKEHLAKQKQVYLCASPNASLSFKFSEDDFSFSFLGNGYSEVFSKKDTVFDGEKYVLNLGDNGSFFIDTVTHEIFCNKLLYDSSLSFSVVGCSLIINELMCNGLINLFADNVSILGIITSSKGAIINAIGGVENLGSVDSPQITIAAEQIHTFGKMTGKNIALNAEFAKFEENSCAVATETLHIKSHHIDLDKSSVISKNANIESQAFEAIDSVISVHDAFSFDGSYMQLKEQSELSVGSHLDIHSGKFQNYGSKISADSLKMALSSPGESFVNYESEISILGDAIISANGSTRNENGTIEARKLLSWECGFLSNTSTSLIESGQVRITAKNVINHTSIIRSLLKDTEFNLSMNGKEFISNIYVHTNSKNLKVSIPTDIFSRNRTAHIRSKFPKPKEKERANTSESTRGPEKEGSGATNKEKQEEQSKKESEIKEEIGSLLNYSGEIISAGSLKINGSGSLYNVSDSILKSETDMNLNFYGKILNKHGSSIKTSMDFIALAKMGIIYFENGELRSGNCKFISTESRFDEFSILAGTGSLTAESEKFTNRGLLQYINGIDIRYGWIDNSGRIISTNDIKISALANCTNRSFTNEGGEIISDQNVFIESINVELGGKIKANEFLYKFYKPKVAEYTFFINKDIVCEKAIYDFGVADLRINASIDFWQPTILFARGIYNEALIKAHAPLTMKAHFIQNGYEHNLQNDVKRFYTYNLYDYEYDFRDRHEVSVTKDDRIYIRSEKLSCAAAILGEDTLIFEADELFYNSGTIESKKKVTLNGKKIQTGWATWEERNIQLPFVEGAQCKYKCHDGIFDFTYDFFIPQKSIIRSYGDMEINGDKFISSFGNVQVFGCLNAHTQTLFLNYAGNISLGKNSHIQTQEFVNTIGTMATNEQGLRYWKIAAATTDPATLICDGILRINAKKYFKNRASYLFSTGDMFLNGKIATDLSGIDSLFINESTGTEYCRMYTISGVDVSKTSRSCCGIRCGSSTTTTYWWQDINENVKNGVIRAAVSSAQSIVAQEFAGAVNTGVIDARSIQAKAIGELGFSHGDKSRLQFIAIPEFNKKLTIERAVNTSDLFSDYLFTNCVTNEHKIPFVIIDDGSISPDDLLKAKPAMTIPEYAQMLYREMLRNYSTSRLSDMPTFADGTVLAEQNSYEIGKKVNLPHFAQAAVSMQTIKPEDIKSGIYFRPYKYTDKYYDQITLFPELYLSDTSLHQVLCDSYGALHAEENINLETSGKFDATASIASGGRTDIKAKSANIETQTFDRHTVTHQNFASASGGGLYGTKTTGIKTQWEKLTASRAPVFITTGRGLGICLQEGESANLQGIVTNIKGKLEVTNGSLVLTPLMVNEVSVNENGSYVIPKYLKTILDVDGDTELEVDVFENTGSEIHSTGKIKIKANQVAQTVLAHEYLANESYATSQSWFSTKIRHEKCYAQKIVMPVITAADIDIQTTGKVSLEGLITSEQDIRIAAGGDVSMASRAFYQSLDYKEIVRGPFTKSSVRRFFENPQIAPNIVRAGGDFILNTLENYYMTGVQSEIIGNKTIKAKNIISRPLRVTQRNEIISYVTNLSVGLPSSVMNASFSMRFSEAGKLLLEQNPMYQAFDNLFGASSQAMRASALVNVGVATYDTFIAISEAMQRFDGEFTSRTALELAAKFFDVGRFGISHTHTHQVSLSSYGIPSVDIIGGDLHYNTIDNAEFIGHLAQAQNITVIAGQKIEVLPNTEIHSESIHRDISSIGYNAVTSDVKVGHGGMNGNHISEIHHPTSFTSIGVNTFQAPSISMTNPLLQACQNRFIGKTKFITLYDVNRGYSSTYNVGLSLSGQRVFAPRGSFSGGKQHFYIETAPLLGIIGDIDVTGTLHNNSVPIAGEITGDYNYSYKAPIRENYGWGIAIPGVDLSSTEEFAQTITRAVKSGLLGYAAGRMAQAAGIGDFASSLIGCVASACANDTAEGFTSLGHISEIRNGHELDIELIGFNIEQFNEELRRIRQAIFDSAVANGVSRETAEQMAEAEIEVVKQEIVEVQEAAKKVKKLVREAKSEAAVAKGGKEQMHETECEDTLLDSLLHRPVYEPSEIEQQLTNCLREVVCERAQMSDQTLAFVPQNKSEAALQEARLLLSKVRDFVAKYPQAAEILRPVASFAERVFDELTIPGGVDNLQKYREGLLTSQEYDLIVSRDAMIDTAAMGVGAFIGRAGGAYGGAIAGGPVVAVAGANLGALEGAAIGGAASKAVRAVARATVHCMAGGGEDCAQRTSDSKERKQATPQDADRYLDGLRDKRVLSRKGITKDGHDYYKFERKCEYMGIKFRKGDYISRDELHHEWEWFGKNKLHKGAVEPIRGDLYKKPELGRVIKLK